MLIQETSYGELDTTRKKLDIEQELLDKVLALPKRPGEEVDFIDLDGTILDDNRRFIVDPGLADHRGDAAYPYIIQKYSPTQNPAEAFREFIKLLDLKNHLLRGYEKFFDPKNPNHVILTAGDPIFQSLKILATGLDIKKENIIIVQDARDKPREILKHLLKIGYIPGRIRFTDDRIYNFDGVDRELSEMLDTEVVFNAAVPNYTTGTVSLQRMLTSSQVESLLNEA